jgi:hypothetical protein
MSDATDLFADAFTDVLIGERGESVIYTPLRGTARTISAIVTRDMDAPISEIGGGNPGNSPRLVVEVRNDGTLGIVSSDTALIGGTISVAERVGQTAKALTIRPPNPFYHDAAIVRIHL